MSDEPEQPEELVSRDDTRALVGEMIFGSDLLSGLTEEQEKLYNSEFGPKKKKTADSAAWVGIAIDIFEKPCPPEHRQELDIVLGRLWRKRIQDATVDDWLIEAGFDLTTRQSFPRVRLEHAMNLYREKARAAAAADVPRGKPGPPPAKTERVAGDMIEDVNFLL
jgi:hypothetical protein